MPVWDAFNFLNELVDDSDPDTDLDQFQHLLNGFDVSKVSSDIEIELST